MASRINYMISPVRKRHVDRSDIYQNSFPKIITVSRLDKRKGHDKILMAIKNLKPKLPKIKYVAIGDGEEKNNLLKLTKELSSPLLFSLGIRDVTFEFSIIFFLL